MPQAINRRLSLDFVADTLSDGRQFRILCMVDDFSRECLGHGGGYLAGCSTRVCELERLASERAVPQAWRALRKATI